MATPTVQELANEFLNGDGKGITYHVDAQANAIFYVGSLRMEIQEVKSRIEQFLWQQKDVPNAPSMIDEISPIVFEGIRDRSKS